MRDYRQLDVWHAADLLATKVYDIATALPQNEKYELAAQLRTAAVSIPSNIAEGCGRGSDPDFERFLSIAAGSTSEIEYQLSFVERRWPSVPGTADARQLANRVRRMLWGLLRTSRSRDPKSDIRDPKSG